MAGGFGTVPIKTIILGGDHMVLIHVQGQMCANEHKPEQHHSPNYKINQYFLFNYLKDLFVADLRKLGSSFARF